MLKPFKDLCKSNGSCCCVKILLFTFGIVRMQHSQAFQCKLGIVEESLMMDATGA